MAQVISTKLNFISIRCQAGRNSHDAGIATLNVKLFSLSYDKKGLIGCYTYQISMSSRWVAERSCLAASSIDAREARSHLMKVTWASGTAVVIASMTCSAFLASRPLKKMCDGLCFARAVIVVLPKPAVPIIISAMLSRAMSKTRLSTSGDQYHLGRKIRHCIHIEALHYGFKYSNEFKWNRISMPKKYVRLLVENL